MFFQNTDTNPYLQITEYLNCFKLLRILMKFIKFSQMFFKSFWN